MRRSSCSSTLSPPVHRARPAARAPRAGGPAAPRGRARGVDQTREVDPGLDAHLLRASRRGPRWRCSRSHPGCSGQPPSSPKADSNELDALLERGEHVGQALAAGVVEVGRELDAARAARVALAKNSPTWRGFAIPVVSPKETSSQPASARRSAISSTRSGGPRPRTGQPKATEITPSQRSPSARAPATVRSQPRRATRRSSGSRCAGCGSPTRRGRR